MDAQAFKAVRLYLQYDGKNTEITTSIDVGSIIPQSGYRG